MLLLPGLLLSRLRLLYLSLLAINPPTPHSTRSQSPIAHLHQLNWQRGLGNRDDDLWNDGRLQGRQTKPGASRQGTIQRDCVVDGWRREKSSGAQYRAARRQSMVHLVGGW